MLSAPLAFRCRAGVDLGAQHHGRSVPIVEALREVARLQGPAPAGLKAVSLGYPLRGSLRVADRPDAPDAATREVPAPGQAWVDAALLEARRKQANCSTPKLTKLS